MMSSELNEGCTREPKTKELTQESRNKGAKNRIVDGGVIGSGQGDVVHLGTEELKVKS